MTALGHVRAQNGIDTGLISRALSLKPLQDVCVDAQRDRLFRRRFNNRRFVPEIVRQIRQVWRRGRLDLSLGDAPKSSEISPPTHSLFTSRWWLSCTLRVHG